MNRPPLSRGPSSSSLGPSLSASNASSSSNSSSSSSAASSSSSSRKVPKRFQQLLTPSAEAHLCTCGAQPLHPPPLASSSQGTPDEGDNRRRIFDQALLGSNGQTRHPRIAAGLFPASEDPAKRPSYIEEEESSSSNAPPGGAFPKAGSGMGRGASGTRWGGGLSSSVPKKPESRTFVNHQPTCALLKQRPEDVFASHIEHGYEVSSRNPVSSFRSDFQRFEQYLVSSAHHVSSSRSGGQLCGTAAYVNARNPMAGSIGLPFDAVREDFLKSISKIQRHKTTRAIISENMGTPGPVADSHVVPFKARSLDAWVARVVNFYDQKNSRREIAPSVRGDALTIANGAQLEMLRAAAASCPPADSESLLKELCKRNAPLHVAHWCVKVCLNSSEKGRLTWEECLKKKIISTLEEGSHDGAGLAYCCRLIVYQTERGVIVASSTWDTYRTIFSKNLFSKDKISKLMQDPLKDVSGLSVLVDRLDVAISLLVLPLSVHFSRKGEPVSGDFLINLYEQLVEFRLTVAAACRKQDVRGSVRLFYGIRCCQSSLAKCAYLLRQNDAPLTLGRDLALPANFRVSVDDGICTLRDRSTWVVENRELQFLATLSSSPLDVGLGRLLFRTSWSVFTRSATIEYLERIGDSAGISEHTSSHHYGGHPYSHLSASLVTAQAPYAHSQLSERLSATDWFPSLSSNAVRYCVPPKRRTQIVFDQDDSFSRHGFESVVAACRWACRSSGAAVGCESSILFRIAVVVDSLVRQRQQTATAVSRAVKYFLHDLCGPAGLVDIQQEALVALLRSLARVNLLDAPTFYRELVARGMTRGSGEPGTFFSLFQETFPQESGNQEMTSLLKNELAAFLVDGTVGSLLSSARFLRRTGECESLLETLSASGVLRLSKSYPDATDRFTSFLGQENEFHFAAVFAVAILAAVPATAEEASCSCFRAFDIFEKFESALSSEPDLFERAILSLLAICCAPFGKSHGVDGGRRCVERAKALLTSFLRSSRYQHIFTHTFLNQNFLPPTGFEVASIIESSALSSLPELTTVQSWFEALGSDKTRRIAPKLSLSDMTFLRDIGGGKQPAGVFEYSVRCSWRLVEQSMPELGMEPTAVVGSVDRTKLDHCCDSFFTNIFSQVEKRKNAIEQFASFVAELLFKSKISLECVFDHFSDKFRTAYSETIVSFLIEVVKALFLDSRSSGLQFYSWFGCPEHVCGLGYDHRWKLFQLIAHLAFAKGCQFGRRDIALRIISTAPFRSFCSGLGTNFDVGGESLFRSWVRCSCGNEVNALHQLHCWQKAHSRDEFNHAGASLKLALRHSVLELSLENFDTALLELLLWRRAFTGDLGVYLEGCFPSDLQTAQLQVLKRACEEPRLFSVCEAFADLNADRMIAALDRRDRDATAKTAMVLALMYPELYSTSADAEGKTDVRAKISKLLSDISINDRFADHSSLWLALRLLPIVKDLSRGPSGSTSVGARRPPSASGPTDWKDPWTKICSTFTPELERSLHDSASLLTGTAALAMVSRAFDEIFREVDNSSTAKRKIEKVSRDWLIREDNDFLSSSVDGDSDVQALPNFIPPQLMPDLKRQRT